MNRLTKYWPEVMYEVEKVKPSPVNMKERRKGAIDQAANTTTGHMIEPTVNSCAVDVNTSL